MIFPALQIGHRLSLWLKLAYTAFMAVLVPVYWHYYGPTNFLYFCDLALFITFVGIWIESSFLVSMCAVGNPSTAGGLGRGFCFEYRWLVLDRDDRLHVQSRELAFSTWAVAIPRLVAILATLSRLGTGVSPTRIAGVDPSRLAGAASVFLLHAAT